MRAQRSWAWLGCCVLAALMSTTCLAGKATTIKSAREKRVEQQEADNKRW